MREVTTMQEFDLLGTGEKMNVFCTNWDEFFAKIKIDRLNKFLGEFEAAENYEMCAIIRNHISSR